MAGMLVTALFFLIFVWVSASYVRRRDPLLRDVMLIFATVAMLFLLGVVQVLIGPLPRPVAVLASVLLLGQPFLTLRLVGRVRPVRGWVFVAAAAFAVAYFVITYYRMQSAPTGGAQPSVVSPLPARS